MAKLTAVTVKALTDPGRYGDGDGLYLSIARGGSRSWIQRIVIDGKRRDLGLGGYPVVSLADARRRASDTRAAVANGRDPLAERRKASTVPTFPRGGEGYYRGQHSALAEREDGHQLAGADGDIHRPRPRRYAGRPCWAG